jgi:outer membrane receptor protein involved in Fe transport
VDSGQLAAFWNEAGYTAIDCADPSTPGCRLGPIFKELNSKYPMPFATSNFSTLNSSFIFTNADGSQADYGVPVFGQATILNSVKLNEFRPDFRFDYNVDAKDVITVHYAVDDYPETQSSIGGDFYNAHFPSISVGKAQTGGLTWTRTISPTMVNEAKFSYLRSRAGFPCKDCDIPSIGTADALGFGFGSSSGLPQAGTENLSTTHGKHTIKLGGEYRRTRNGSEFAADENGLYFLWDTEDLLTDGAIGDAAGMGMAYYSEASVDPSSSTPGRPEYYRGFRANEYGFYAEDAIKVTKNLTVTAGLRWDYFGPPHNFRPGFDANLYDGSSSFNQCRSGASGSPVCFPTPRPCSPASS